MTKPSYIKIIATCLWLLAPQLFAKTVYTFGVVPQFEARALLEIWAPIFKALETNTGFEIKFVGSPTIAEFEQNLASGAFDFAYMNPYHLIIANQQKGYVPIVRDGERKLFGVLAVAKGGPIKSISDLQNKKIAFPSPNALGASLMMRAILTEKEKIKFSPQYSQTHTSSYLNVLLGQASAAGGVMSTFKKQSSDIQNKLEIIYRTPKVAPHPIATLPKVPEHHRKLIMDAFFKISKTKDGLKNLEKIPLTHPMEAKLKDYTELKQMNLERYYETPK